MATLQEMREKREALNGELKKLSVTIDERRSAGKSGKDLWSDSEQAAYQNVTSEIATLQESIEGEERADSLVAHLAKSAEQRGKQTRFGRTDPRLDDDMPGNPAGAKYGDVFDDRDLARRFARTEESRSLVFHADRKSVV